MSLAEGGHSGVAHRRTSAVKHGGAGGRECRCPLRTPSEVDTLGSPAYRGGNEIGIGCGAGSIISGSASKSVEATMSAAAAAAAAARRRREQEEEEVTLMNTDPSG